MRCLYGKLSDSSATDRRKALFSEDFILGFTKYLDLDVVGFASNAIAILAILWIPDGVWVLPWAVAFGGLTLYIVGSVCFARGLTFESCSFFTFGSLWLIWGPARGMGFVEQVGAHLGVTGERMGEYMKEERKERKMSKHINRLTDGQQNDLTLLHLHSFRS